MNMPMRKYPVGIQTFSEIRKEGYIYIDKTDLVWKLSHMAKYVFLSRPRRFGKSLLTTTLDSYYRGEKALFEGLKIMEFEQEWKRYPVIHIDLSTAKNKQTPEELRRYLNLMLERLMPQYANNAEVLPGEKLSGMISRCYESMGSQVVLLIDEYDSPLLDVLHDDGWMSEMKLVMQEFYQPLKACESMVKFCFMTGITKFSQLSIFSTLNNIMNVSMNPEFSAICGITEQELVTAMKEDIEMLAQYEGYTVDEMHAKLKMQYDGYHFSEHSAEVYNPYSLMNCFAQKRVKNYWFESGTPTFLYHQMKRYNTDITSLDGVFVPDMAFDRPTETMTDAIPLMYQSGYLTIKDYDKESQGYTLGIPNNEVRVGLIEGLIPLYSGLNSGDVQLGCAFKIWRALKNGDVDTAMRELQAYLAGVPYVEGFKKKLDDAVTKEGFYEYTLYLILSMMNVYVCTQVKCADGRVDMVVKTASTIYIFEFKVRESATGALRQIEEKGYADTYQTDGRKIVKVGVRFDTDKLTIKDWKIAN